MIFFEKAKYNTTL